MKRLACGVSVLSVLVLSVLSSSRAADDQTPTIKQIMAKLHKGAKSPLAQVKTALKSDSPHWAQIQKSADSFVMYGAALAKNDPPRGDKGAYEKLSNDFYADAKALQAAAEKEDKAAAQAAFQKLSTSCKACHSAHKGK